MRNEQGKFVKGTSGNPLGRPRVILTVRDIAREHTEEAIETLAAIMRDEVAPAAARISACTELLNRGHGRPVDQRAMLMISAQLSSDRSVKEMSTQEIIQKLSESLPFFRENFTSKLASISGTEQRGRTMANDPSEAL
ncbi:hypothetical protein MCEREM21A_02960 [Sphingomonadaceae bacterium]